MANKTQVIEALGERLGDRKVAADALDHLVDIIVRTVESGERVTITGFGAFEKRTRAARTARNPRTGATVDVGETEVPSFRAGTMFRDVVGGKRTLPAAGTVSSSAPAKDPAAKPAAKSASKPKKAKAKAEKDSGKKKSKKGKKGKKK